jgi:hypothetical protein
MILNGCVKFSYFTQVFHLWRRHPHIFVQYFKFHLLRNLRYHNPLGTPLQPPTSPYYFGSSWDIQGLKQPTGRCLCVWVSRIQWLICLSSVSRIELTWLCLLSLSQLFHYCYHHHYLLFLYSVVKVGVCFLLHQFLKIIFGFIKTLWKITKGRIASSKTNRVFYVGAEHQWVISHSKSL